MELLSDSTYGNHKMLIQLGLATKIKLLFYFDRQFDLRHIRTIGMGSSKSHLSRFSMLSVVYPFSKKKRQIKRSASCLVSSQVKVDFFLLNCWICVEDGTLSLLIYRAVWVEICHVYAYVFECISDIPVTK